MEKQIDNTDKQEIRANIVDRCLEQTSSIESIDKLALAGVALIISGMLEENTNALLDVQAGRLPNFPHPDIGLTENPSPKVRAAMVKMFPILAKEVFDKNLEADNL